MQKELAQTAHQQIKDVQTRFKVSVGKIIYLFTFKQVKLKTLLQNSEAYLTFIETAKTFNRIKVIYREV